MTVNLTAVVAEPVQHVIDTDLGHPTIIAAADIDGDGDTDIAASGWGTYLYKNDGSGGFGTTVTVQATAGGAGDRMRIADMDGDSELDIINNSSVGVSPQYTLIWYQNDGNENFTQNNILATSSCDGIDTGDFDGDGLTDELVV